MTTTAADASCKLHIHNIVRRWNFLGRGSTTFHRFLREYLYYQLCKSVSLNSFFVIRLQPNAETEAKRLVAWQDLTLEYCRFHKIHTLDVQES